MNRALEDACQKNRDHGDPAQVYMKVRLINRAYSANLEQNRKVQWPEWEVAKALAKSAAPIMHGVSGLRKLERPTLWPVVNAHYELMKIARRATRTWTVSFCSKYLSFHFPQTAPIYDAKSVQSAKALLPSLEAEVIDPKVREYDYGKHCSRVLALLGRLREAGVKSPRLRIVDYVLYSALDAG